MKPEILVKYKKSQISLEDAMDALADCGYCVNLLNDDAGRWAFTADGYQSIVINGPSDVSTHFYVQKRFWKKSIRQAFIYFLNRL